MVVCPVVAVLQWAAEIERYTLPGTLKVARYHGAKRKADAGKLVEADVVLTTYSTLEVDYRMRMMPAKAQCWHCGKKYYPDK